MTARCPRCRRDLPLAKFMGRQTDRTYRSVYCSQCRAAVRSHHANTRWGSWGLGLVCDCEPSVILGRGQCIHCGRPAVASMADHLQERMFLLVPPSAAQTVVSAPTEARAS